MRPESETDCVLFDVIIAIRCPKSFYLSQIKADIQSTELAEMVLFNVFHTTCKILGSNGGNWGGQMCSCAVKIYLKGKPLLTDPQLWIMGQPVSATLITPCFFAPTTSQITKTM